MKTNSRSGARIETDGGSSLTRSVKSWAGRATAVVTIALTIAATFTGFSLALTPEAAQAATPAGYTSVPSWAIGATTATTTLPGNAAAFGNAVLTNVTPGQTLTSNPLDGVNAPRYYPSSATVAANANACVNGKPLKQINTCGTFGTTVTLPHPVVDPIIAVSMGGGGNTSGTWCTEGWYDFAFTGVNGAAPVAGVVTPTGATSIYSFAGNALTIPQATVNANTCQTFSTPIPVYIQLKGLVSSYSINNIWRAAVVLNPNNVAVGGGAIGGATTNLYIPTVDLSIAKTAPAVVDSNGTITWNVNVTNNGPSNSHGFVIKDVVPSNVSNVALVTAPAGCVLTGNDLNCAQAPPGCTIAQNGTVATWADLTCTPNTAADATVLASGGTFGPITLTATAPTPRGTVVTNTATVSGADSDPNTSNNTSTATTTVQAPTLQVGKNVAGRVSATDQFTVGANNAGGTTVTSITTVGTATTATSPAVQVVKGQTYTITDAVAAGSASGLNSYGASLICTDSTTGVATPVPGAGPSWQFTPTTNDVFSCVVTNAPLTKSFTVTKAASATSAAPGDVITYSVTVTNTGQFAYTGAQPASFTDNLANVLDDATYNGDVSTGGAVAGNTLTWSGALAVGETKTVTYSVTVNDPDTGNHLLVNTVVPNASTGGSCSPAGSCTTTTPVMSFTYQKTSSAATTTPGGVVTYTVTLKNTGGFAYTAATPATITDDLTGVLDDATYNGDVTAGGSVTGNTLAWSGALAVGATVNITYSVTVNNPVTGDGHLLNTVTSANPGSDCAPGATCETDTPIASYTVQKTSDTVTALQGDTVTYTVTVSNTGEVAYTAGNLATFADDLTDVLDDAVYNGDVSTGGTVTGSTLTWAGTLALGQTKTVTYSVTIDNPDTGNHVLANAVVPTAPGGGCDPAGECITNTPVSSLNVVKTSTATEVNPGDVIPYTITITNNGQVDFTTADPASFSDDLTEVLDDATYNNDVTSSSGAGASYNAPTIAWSGPLAIGETVTIGYTVTVDDPDNGDKRLNNTVVTPPGLGNCPVGSTDPSCIVVIPASSFTLAKTSSATSAIPGDTVTYAVTVTNTGNVAYTTANPASFSDDLSRVLDDATYNGDVTAGGAITGTTLTWSGALAVGASTTATYSVTVNDPDTGNHSLLNVVVPTAPGGQCDAAADCTTTTPVASYIVSKTASTANATPGSAITYTVTVSNTGQVPYTAANPAAFTDDLTDVLDDATYNGDVTAGGTVTGSNLSWTGEVAVGATTTVTYSVTVNNPDTGNHILTNAVVPTAPGGDCDPAGTCVVDTPVSSYTVSKTASAATASPDDVITYTVTVTNTGETAYTAANPATFTDDLTAVLDDATYNGDVSAGGSVGGNILTWTGALPIGGTVDVTYSVTVNNPDAGDHILTNAVVPTAPGGSCDPNGDCTVETPLASYTVAKTSSATSATPGSTVTYTVSVVNTGQVAYTLADPATFEDDLSDVLDDASYNGDVSAGGQVTGNTLTWTGPLAIGATTLVTYTVTIDNPDTGNHILTNAVVPTGPGGGCDPAGSCVTDTPVSSYTVSKTASAATATPGSVLSYTVTVTNTGETAYTSANPAKFTDDLSAVLDDATYNDDVTAGGTVDGTTLSWTGPLAIGGSATVTYSVTVNSPDTGDHILTNAVVPTAPGGECDPEAECVTETPVSSYTVSKTASTDSATPGSTITYSVTVTNTGEAPYTDAAPATFSDDLSAVLDDASYNDDVTAGGSVAGTILTWSGPLVVGATTTVTYSVTVDDPDNGDHILTNAVVPTSPGGECDPAGTCETTTPVASYSVLKTSPATTVAAGDVVQYSIQVTNTGQVDYTDANPASLTDSLVDVLDDAAYNNDLTSDSGTGTSYSAPVIAWSGPLAIGATVTITYSVTINAPDTGDQQLDNTVVTPPGTGGNCPVDSDNPDCTVELPGSSYTVAKTSSATSTLPGSTVTYAVTVTNTGQVDYTDAAPASFTDDLTRVLDDAAYNGDITAGGAVTGNTLTWSGPLAIGASTTVTYSVTVDDPDTGDHVLTNAVVPTAPGGACDTEGTCITETPVLSYTVSKAASTATATPGSVLTYTVTVINTGGADFTASNPITITDDLAGVLDDATYNDDVTAGGAVTGTTLTWTGAVAVGATASITYSVTVNSPDTGDHILTNAVVPTTPGGECDQVGSCTTTTPVSSYTVSKTASAGTAIPGDTITYTVEVTNTGEVDYTAGNPATFTDDLTAVLDDASYNGDVSTGGTVAGNTLNWAGPLAIGATVAVTYSVTIDNPDTGDHLLTNAVVPTAPGGECDPEGSCVTETPVASVEVVKTSTSTEVTPGESVPYTIVITNTGQVDYTDANPASFSDDLSAVLDDATYNGDVSSSSGTGTSYAAPVLAWSGPLAVGASVTITYSVTVNEPVTGDSKLSNTVVTPPEIGGNCPPGSTDPDCIANVPAASFTISKVASSATTTPGSIVTYTVTVTNTGAIDYTTETPASFSDDLSRVLDDSAYNDDVSAGGSVTGTTLTWAGPLPVGASIQVTYSVTVDDPDLGDHVLTNAVVPTAPGGSCDLEGECTTTTPVASYTVAKTSDASEASSGQTVTYAITVTNTGAVDYTLENPASFNDDLTDVLDDASYNGDVTDGGEVTDATLTWNGALPAGQSTTVTYSVTVNTPDTGNHVLANVVVPTTPGGGCGPDGGCTTTTEVRAYAVAKTVSTTSAHPGEKVTFTVTVTNTGEAAYTTEQPASFTDDLSNALVLGSYNNDASSGATYAAPIISWTGALDVDQVVTVTYSITVKAGATGAIRNVVVTPPGSGANCPPGSSDPSCGTSTPVTPGAITPTDLAHTGFEGAWVLLAGLLFGGTGAALFITTRIRRRTYAGS